MKVFQTSSSSSELTPTNWNAFPEYFLFRSRRMGTDSRQGGHQVPQKSSSTTFPRSEAFEMLCLSCVMKENLGANGMRARMGLAITIRASATVSGIASREAI